MVVDLVSAELADNCSGRRMEIYSVGMRRRLRSKLQVADVSVVCIAQLSASVAFSAGTAAATRC